MPWDRERMLLDLTETCVGIADKALDRAKRTGRDRAYLADPADAR